VPYMENRVVLHNKQGDILKGIGITCLIFFLSVSVPLLGFFFSLLIPMPILFYRTKLGRHTGGIIFAVSFMIMAVSIGQFSFDAVYFSGLMLTGFVLSELFEMNLPVEQTVLGTSGILAGTALICLYFYSTSAGTDIGSVVSEYVTANLSQAVKLYEEMGMPEETIALISDSLETIRHGLLRILPAMAVSATLFLTWSVLLMARPLMKIGNLPYPDFGSLTLWKAPDFLVWAVISCGGMMLIPDTMIRIIAFNGLIILMTVYFFGGIAVVAYYFEKKNFSPFLRFFLYSIIALWQMALLLVIGLGFFDMWVNFRKLETNGSKE